ncbi:MAG: UPF0175 family protein [Thiohalocapsa sp.]|uniref:UPF0175 family protein n=1 Tax=Thiohalocapsa sp. TaxID=2497641 RepID=UPI00345B60AB|nr:UPF0175 family protein [Thiohalocapsa sp.]
MARHGPRPVVGAPGQGRFLLALKLFELGRISSGKAAILSGMGRVEFLLAAWLDIDAGSLAVSVTAG